MENTTTKSNKHFFFRKYGTTSGLIMLTVGLMFVFKNFQKDIDNIIDEGVNLYTNNLKPLFVKDEITNEDLINFAFYETLPIDKKNSRYIVLGKDNVGNENFVIKRNESIQTNNYEKFITFNKLDERKIQVLDSILNTYKEDIYTSILFNENNTFAISQSLPQIRDLLRYDLVAFAEEPSENKFTDKPEFIWTTSAPDIRKYRQNIRNANREDFIFFNPDTVFTYECQFDKSKIIQSNIEKYKIQDAAKYFEFKVMCNDKELSIVKPFDISVEKPLISYYDDEKLRIVIPKPPDIPYNIKEQEELVKELENIKKELTNITISIQSDSGNVQLNINVIDLINKEKRLKMKYEVEQMNHLKNLINILPRDFNIQIDIDTLAFDYDEP
ncbi:MAG: hypothetical protein JXA68_12030 [Ignavibacteriales bacterium]|nr:hypothetical protein [Ignavibacteriales bacterium]